MGDMLKMQTRDFMRMEELIKKGELADKASSLLNFDVLREISKDSDWETRPIVQFHEELSCKEAGLFRLAEVLQSLKMPYEYFCDANGQTDDYWEVYSPEVGLKQSFQQAVVL